ncbi:hypothetical protein KBC75_01220 [Candidatus Shapirobacteria bacterium]|nr:hypothetical protein [Candidatus Shapirobacteria bacterium]
MNKKVVSQTIFFLLFSFIAPLSIISHTWNVNAVSPLTSPITPPTTPFPTLPLTPPLTSPVTPTIIPTIIPTTTPTLIPTNTPTNRPTNTPTVTPTNKPICKTGVNSFAVSGYCKKGLASSVKFTCYDGYTKSVKGVCAPVSSWKMLVTLTCMNHKVCR